MHSVKKPYMRIAFLLIFLGIICALWFGFLRSHITLEHAQNSASLLQEFVHDHYAFSVLIFIGVYILIALMGLPLAALATITGGFLFGTIMAAIYTNIGATIGGLGFFLLVRYAIGSYFQKRFVKRSVQFNQLVHKKGNLFLIVIHFMPFIPFSVVNTLAGLTQISSWTFIWTTAVGIFPASLIQAYAGKQLNTIHSMRDIFSGNVLFALLLLMLIGIIPLVVSPLRKFIKV